MIARISVIGPVDWLVASRAASICSGLRQLTSFFNGKQTLCDEASSFGIHLGYLR